MLSSKSRCTLWALGILTVTLVCPHAALAQQQASGFDVERLYTSAPGGGWLVMDTLDMHGGLGGAVNLVTSYARNPLRITDGAQHLSVVSDEAFLQLGMAGTYDRFRFYFTFDSPLTVQGNSGTIAGYTFTAPSVDLASSPDAISHGRIGVDARVLGAYESPFRLGLSAQLWFPGGAPGALRANYLSDGPPTGALGAYNAMGRVLVAGDIGFLTYAGHLGINLRALDDSPTPGSPQGTEILFGAAAGAKIPLCVSCDERLVVGPEVFGATAVRSLFGETSTAFEGLLTARIEGASDDRPHLRFKLGAGGGIHPQFGAPEARIVFGIELFENSAR